MNYEHVALHIRSSEALNALAVANDFAGIKTALNAKTITRTDTQLWTAKGILKRFGIETGAGILAGFEAATQQPGPLGSVMRSMWNTLSSGGIDFSDELTQAQIDALAAAGAWAESSAAVAVMLKEIGTWQESLATSKFGAELTDEDMTAVAAHYARIQLSELLQTRFNRVTVAVRDGLITTEQAAIAKFGE